LHGPWP
jgi:3a0107s01c2: phosphate ABC transporter, ATP-binding protein